MADRLSYTDVRNADLAPLSEAVTKWNRAPGKFQQVGTNFHTEVTKGLAHSNWSGEAASEAWKTFRRVSEQLHAAQEEAGRVHTVMRQGLEKFRSAQKALDDIERELDGHEHLKLNRHDGSVHLDLTVGEEGTHAGLNKAYQDTFAAYRERTRRALDLADRADSDLAQALSTDVNGDQRGFNDHAYGSLGAARAQAARDLKEALRLARTGNGELTPADLARLDTLLARHGADGVFAERFATGLGPERTLQLWYNVTHPRNVLHPDTDIDDKTWWKRAGSFQKHLGTTLAGATRVGGRAMRQWEDGVLARGPQRLESGGTTHPYGYQLMSGLLRFGTYDSGFLNRYGDRLVAWDKKHNTRDGYAYWANSAPTDTLDPHGAGDTGHDALTGFLEGLGHNPEAATEFFRQPAGVQGVVDRGSELNAHLKYLTKDRNWIFDGYSGDPRELPGHEALGHALTAATTGYAWDADELSGKAPEPFARGDEHRTAATAGVMEQVVRVYGGEDGPKLLHEQPAIAPALGAMGGAYVDDINRNVSGVGEDLQSDAFPPAYEGHADFGRAQAVDFLSVLGQHETSHATMNQAEHLYTLDRLASRPPADSDESWAMGRRALLTEAEVRGTLDHSRVRQIEAQYAADSQEAQDAFRQSANWTRVGMNASAPAVANGVLSLVGKSGPWGVVVPIAQAGAVEFAKLFHDDAVFGGPDVPEPPTGKDQFFDRGERELGATAGTFLQGHGPGPDATGELADAIKGKYLAIGPQGDAFEGREPYTG